ncbi:Eukaryotic translation initiation factor 4 gamma [Psilocybe cubensis]|uniref:Eukaryotic translation initiation factor 4 gamma n=2 Tax=Psilocybe cubensis TaxID=181762 RepID=A0ACB8HBY6_PSICU|nr:Eukaryotic translation initiation factor 4 gamma [Psilocybe cubensis]KAH9485515.1 Eukaryotic translation initiation factor 4 gamma [Psilocybe cubensis]
MSKSSTATAPKNPTPLPAKSAWAKGPPQTATAPSPRSQSPAPSTPTHQTHSRRPSTLGQGIPIKDGVSVPRNNVGAVKQGSAVTFGSIDDVSAPISSSPAAAPSLKAEVVKSFGTVPATGHVNGKASISSRASVATPAASSSSASSSSSTATPAAASSAAALPKPKIDIKKMFQNPTSAPASNPPPDTSSPSQRNVNLPVQQSPLHQSQSVHTPLTPHSFSTFVPRLPQNTGPNGGPPRSPQYPRQLPNGNGPRPQGGQNGGPSTGMPSPRLGPHPHNGQPSQMAPAPQMQPQMPAQMPMGMPWGGYYPYPPDQQYMYSAQWYPSMPMQQPHGQHQPPTPGLPPHGGMPMSPRNPPASLQTPGTPILSQALPNPTHAPHPPPVLSHPTHSMGGLTSPPTTPSTSSIPNRLNAASNAFVPRQPSRVTLKKEDGTEVKLENLKSPAPSSNTSAPTPQGSAYRQGSPGTPTRRPASVRIESEDQRKIRLAEEENKEKEKARLKAEAEEKARKEKEEAERKVREAEEKKRQEEEAEKERIRKEEEEKEAERLRREEEERARKEAEEREAQRLREEEERKRQEEEAAEAKRIAEEKAKKEAEERAEQERIEKEKAEQARLAKEAEEERLRIEEEEKRRLEEEAAKSAKEPEPELDGKSESTLEEGEVVEDNNTDAKDDGKDKPKESLRINTGATSPTVDRRQRPGPLDLTNAKNSNIPAPQTALATARIISDISSVQYPAGVSSPRPDLNENAKEGKFRYDRDFLLQFMSICKEKPAMLPPLDAIGLEPADQSQHQMTRTQSGRRTGPGGAPASRQSSIGLGFPAGTFNKGSGSLSSMGQFSTVGASKLSSQERFEAARPVSVSGASGMQFTNRPQPMTRTTSQGGPGGPLRDRTRSKRGEKRGENNKAAGGNAGGQQGHGGAFNNYHQQQQQQNLEPVAPLQATANRWDRKAIQADADSPEMVDRKVKGLLNKLTMEKFDSISDQIIAWANKSEKEKDGRTLIQVIRLVFEKATDEATWSEMYARLCRKMMEQISPKVQDDGIKNNEGKPIAGGQLFRKYLLNRCQEDFERGWVAKEATAAAAASKALEDEAIKAAHEKGKADGKDEEVALYSDEYYAAQKAKRQGLGLIKFIGELFKLQMLTERIMHECVKKLLGNVDNPEEEEIESLCKLLGTVGGILDTPKARAHLDVYFARMKELIKSPNVTPRMQYMLQDLVELRERKWVARNAVAAPTTIAAIHENAAKEKAAAEKESYQRQISMSRGGSRRGGDRNDFNQVNPDGWAVAGGGSGPSRPPPKAGDLSNFGKISKAQPMTFGPSSVFAGKKGAENKRESISRTSSSSNMFSMLSAQGAESSEPATKPAEPAQRKRLVLQPRSKPVESEATELETASPVAGSESDSDEEAASEVEMSEADALKKIKEDLKEFFAVRNLEEAEVYFKIPAQHHHTLVDKFVSSAVESKEADAKLVSDFFEAAASKELCTAQAFEDGFTPIAEVIDDIAIDAPKAFQLFALMIKGAKLDDDRRQRLASKSMDSDKLLALLQ